MNPKPQFRERWTGWLRSSVAGFMTFAMFIALATLEARANQPESPTASVATSQSTVDLGDSFVYQVTVEGATDVKPPTLPPSDAWDAEYMGGRDESMRSTISVNGRVTEYSSLKYVMQWRITPKRIGPASVDTFTFEVDGKPVRAPRVQFRVNEPQQSPNFRLSLESDRTDCYVGEPMRLRLVWSVGANVKSAAFTGPDGDDMFDVQALDPRPAKSRGTPINPNEPWRSVPFLGREVVITRSQGMLDGRTVPVFTLDLVVTPRQAGALVIGPYRVACDEVVGQRARGFFQSPFDDLSQTRRTVTTGNSLTLQVRPLPADGKPAGFTGLIGRYSIEAASTNTEANVGDPVPLTITIRGPEPMPGLSPPDLTQQPDFDAAFKSAPEGWEAAASESNGERRFTTTVRPRSDSITQIPAIRLPFFDTVSGTYALAESAPIPLMVRPSRRVTAADATGAGPLAPSVTAKAAAPARLTSAPAGVGANVDSLDALVDRHVSIMAMAASLPGIGLLSLPPLIVLIAWTTRTLARRTDPARAARQAALKRAARELDGSRSVAEMTGAIRMALAPFLAMTANAVTSDDARTGSLPPGTAGAAAELLDALERGAYGDAASAHPDRLRARAQELLVMLREVE